jgi:hypothetical protein
VAPACRRGGRGGGGAAEGDASLAPGVEEPKKRRTPAVDWAGLLRRRFALDIFACAHCAGRLKGVFVREGSPRSASDCEAPGPSHGRCEAGPGARATSGSGGGGTQDNSQAQAPAAHLKGGRPGQQCAPWGCSAPYTGLAHCWGGPRPRPSSAPALQPSPSTGLPFF